MPHDPLIAVQDILREIEFLQGQAEEMDFGEFEKNSQAIRAAAYSVQTISEAVRHIPKDWLESYPEQPWKQILAIGNKIRHEYFRLSDAILWQVVTKDIQSLETVMSDMLEKKKDEPQI